MKYFRFLNNAYIKPLPFIMFQTSYLGFVMGVSNNNTNINCKYASILGYTGAGIISGITYPISIPIFWSYLLNNKK